MSSDWQKADDVARLAATMAGEILPSSARIAGLVSELAVVARNCAERVGLRAETVGQLEPGQTYELTLRVRATVVDRHDGHGLSYQLELDRRDYYGGQRTVSVDADEIVGADQ